MNCNYFEHFERFLRHSQVLRTVFPVTFDTLFEKNILQILGLSLDSLDLVKDSSILRTDSVWV